MRLNSDSKIRLLRSCTQVKIIELTEKMANFNSAQIQLLKDNPNLRDFVVDVYKKQMEKDGLTAEEAPSFETLATTYLPELKEYIKSLATETEFKDLNNDKFDQEKVFERALKDYVNKNVNMQRTRRALDEYRTLADKVTAIRVDVADVQQFMDTDKTKHTKSFERFAKGIKAHTPMHLGVYYSKLADEIAKRNNIVDKEYTTKAGRTFKIDRPTLHLERDFNTRLKHKGVGLALGTALAALLVAGTAFFSRNSSKATTSPTQETITVAPPETAGNQTVETGIFTNSVKNFENYEDACTDYFEKISDLYRYYTDGKEIDLSGYGQKQIGFNGSVRILNVELNGETYIFSGQGDTAPNYQYLKKALEATGATVEESSCALTCIIDKNDSNRSIVIADNLGNSLRSGKVLTGSNNAYNQIYVNAGRKILEEQGISNPTEAQCVGAYLLSDAHAPADPELAQAVADVSNLTYAIKTTFYGDNDPYAVYLYSNKSSSLAENFEAEHNIEQDIQQAIAPNSQKNAPQTEHEDKER